MSFRSLEWPSHEAVTSAVFFTVLFIQFFYFGWFLLRARACERGFAIWQQSSSVFGGPRIASWISWVNERFTSRKRHASTAERADALSELQLGIEADGVYHIVQKIPSLGPMLGVLLTLYGLYQIDVPEGGKDSTETMRKLFLMIQPLSLGMGAGVGLALVGLLFSFKCEQRSADIRSAGRRWFEQHVPSVIDNDKLNEKLTAVVTRLTKAMGTHSAHQAGVSNEIVELRKLVTSATATLTPLLIDLVPLSDELKASRAATESIVGGASRITSEVEELIASFKAAGDSLKDVVAPGLTEATKALDSSVSVLSTRIDEAAERACEADGQLLEIQRTQTEVSERAKVSYEAVDASLKKMTESISSMASSFAKTSERIRSVDSASDKLETAILKLSENVSKDLGEMSSACRESAKFVREQQQELAERLRTLDLKIENVDHTTAACEEGAELLGKLIVLAEAGLKQSSNAVEQLATSLNELAQIHSSAKSFAEHGPEAAESLKILAERSSALTRIIDQYRPLTQSESLVDALEKVAIMLRRVEYSMTLLPNWTRSRLPEPKSSWFHLFSWGRKKRTRESTLQSDAPANRAKSNGNKK